MMVLRLAFGLVGGALFLVVFGPLRRLAQARGWELGKSTPVIFHRLLCLTLDIRVRRFGAASPRARRLIVANHVSWLDIPVLGAVEPMTFLAKKEIGKPFLGRQVAGLQGIVYVDRERKRAIPDTNRAMVEAMRRGESVTLFAEATTGDGNRLLRFRSSHFEAIRAAAAEGEPTLVQPVLLHYNRLRGLRIGRRDRPTVAWYGDMTFLPHLWQALRAGGLGCDVHYGEPILVAPGDNRKAIARDTERAMRRLWTRIHNGGRRP